MEYDWRQQLSRRDEDEGNVISEDNNRYSDNEKDEILKHSKTYGIKPNKLNEGFIKR